MRLSSGIEIGFAPRDAEGLRDAIHEDLAEIEVEALGPGLHFPRIDAGLYVPALPALLEGVLGSRNWMAARLGAAGGRARGGRLLHHYQGHDPSPPAPMGSPTSGRTSGGAIAPTAAQRVPHSSGEFGGGGASGTGVFGTGPASTWSPLAPSKTTAGKRSSGLPESVPVASSVNAQAPG